MKVDCPGNLARDIEALKNGDQAAFEHIYHCYGPKLYAFTNRFVYAKEDVEEVVQEVFIKLWERKHFLDSHDNFDGYLFRIAKNIVYNKARHKVYELAYSKFLAGEKSITENATEANLNYQELNQLLEQTYSTLPPVRRQVFVMSRVEGLSNNEIAEKLHTSTSNIENHINKAVREIRVKLKSYKIIYLLLLSLFMEF